MLGEAYYYLRARFKSGEDLRKKFEAIKNFLTKEGKRAEEYWHRNRFLEVQGKRDIFWRGFRKRFPLVYKYLQTVTKKADGDCNNDLAGILAFSDMNGQVVLFQDCDNFLCYRALVWHFANWNPLTEFLKQHFGAVDVEWISAESLDPWLYLKINEEKKQGPK